ncbi:MAG: hypothetical protein Q7S60_04350 [bacterium]|nr:hypothetical protein [bacterium]
MNRYIKLVILFLLLSVSCVGGFLLGRVTAPTFPSSITVCAKPLEAVEIAAPAFPPPPYQSPIQRWWLNTFCGQAPF